MRSTCCRRAAAQTIAARTSAIHPVPYSWVNPDAPGPSSGPLAGRAIAIKDNISYISSPTSCSSLILQDYNPPYSATCVESLVEAGAHITGQTKMDEFGMGSQTTHLPPHYTPVHNPASPSPGEPPRSAGGSSGGSAAAVAEGSCWAALGTDTGGSVRLPASYCGVVGLKPSYGLISRHGIVSYADSLDCVGILAKTTDITRQVFSILSHPDEKDMTCVSSSSRKLANEILDSHQSKITPTSTHPLIGIRIGLPLQTHLPAPHVQTPPSLLEHLQSLGATLHPVDIPSFKMALPAYYVLASAEASSNLGRYGGGWVGSKIGDNEGEFVGESGEERRKRIRSGRFGPEVKKRILAGTYALSADEFNNTYLKALHLRSTLRRQFNSIFRIPHPLRPSHTAPTKGIDILLHPTAFRTAPLLDSSTERGQSEYLQDLLTVPASLAGLPALSVPAGKLNDGWPVGMSLTGQWGMEDLIFRIAEGVEKWDKTR
ncbi:amidase signature domain-containing protein [Naematelia encephala]|uniref:Glutamyl-tRNA(Gln) amidotransferase subunit A, mitochondrial n=1 Tax=Naematelia encephala TaxID=71784 RepID=A0A1Y2AS16_9TREE|nr:amidase signature domain-containing protein [Naematelia encephala]